MYTGCDEYTYSTFTLNSQDDIGLKPVFRKAFYEENQVEKQIVQMSLPEGEKGNPCKVRYTLMRASGLLYIKASIP